MGKGDVKTKRGKIIMGSYGVRRKKRKDTNSGNIVAQVKTKAAPAKEKKPKLVEEPKAVEATSEKKVKAETTTEKPAAKKPASKSTKKEPKPEIGRAHV